MVTHEAEERLEKLAVRFIQSMRVDLHPRTVCVHAIGKKLLCSSRIPENIEDTGRCGISLGAKRCLDPRRKLGLLVELLESPFAREEPVSQRTSFKGARLPRQPGRDNQHIAGKIPGFPERRCPLVRTFDDIDDVAEIDDVRLALLGPRSVRRIPTIHGVA